MKKALVPILLALFLFTSCRSPDPVNTLTTGPPESTIVSTTVESSIIPSTTETIPHPSITEETTPSESVQSIPMESKPVTAQTTIPDEFVPSVTHPATTEPPEQEKPTEPAPTEPAPTVHQHSYSAEVVKATCTAAGYTVHTCPCGDSYTDSQTPATGHAYTETVIKPTMWKQGYTTYTCTGCSDSYTDNYTNISEADKEAFIQEVREATLKYINQFRSEPAESLPGLTQVASYRAVQLHDNFAHSTADLREALAYYQYGEYKTPAGWDPSEYYYDFPGREAISRTSKTGTADEIGKRLAQNFYNSSSHWAYVGSSDYSYIAVGVSYDAASMGGYCWTCCVFVTDTNQYG